MLQAEHELAHEPVHITIVGRKDDSDAEALYRAALRYPAAYRRIGWWDKREGPLPHDNVRYPELARAAAFACSESLCSAPVFEAEAVAAAVDRLKR